MVLMSCGGKGHQHQHSRTSDVDISIRHDVTPTVTPDVKVLYKSHWLDSQLADFLVNFGFWSSCEVFPQYFFVLTTGIECRESRTSLREEEGTADCCGDCRHLRYQDNYLPFTRSYYVMHGAYMMEKLPSAWSVLSETCEDERSSTRCWTEYNGSNDSNTFNLQY